MGDYILRLRERAGPDLVLQLPSVSVGVRDGAGRLLMVKHVEHGLWLLPGGSIEPGETPADAAVRECWEELGMLVKLTKMVGVFSGPEFLVKYRSGEQVSYVMTVFEAQGEAGELSANPTEILAARFTPPGEAGSLDLALWVPEVLDALQDRASGRAAFRAPTWRPASGA